MYRTAKNKYFIISYVNSNVRYTVYKRLLMHCEKIDTVSSLNKFQFCSPSL